MSKPNLTPEQIAELRSMDTVMSTRHELKEALDEALDAYEALQQREAKWRRLHDLLCVQLGRYATGVVLAFRMVPVEVKRLEKELGLS